MGWSFWIGVSRSFWIGWGHKFLNCVPQKFLNWGAQKCLNRSCWIAWSFWIVLRPPSIRLTRLKEQPNELGSTASRGLKMFGSKWYMEKTGGFYMKFLQLKKSIIQALKNEKLTKKNSLCIESIWCLSLKNLSTKPEKKKKKTETWEITYQQKKNKLTNMLRVFDRQVSCPWQFHPRPHPGRNRQQNYWTQQWATTPEGWQMVENSLHLKNARWRKKMKKAENLGPETLGLTWRYVSFTIFYLQMILIHGCDMVCDHQSRWQTNLPFICQDSVIML